MKRTVVCLCGSTRFMQAFYDANMRETLEGKVVLTVGMSSQGACKPNEEQKKDLDALHLDKIDMADEILVLNCPVMTCHNCKKPCESDAKGWSNCCRAAARFKPYVGDSTRSEIAHATRAGKKVRYLENPS